MAPAASTSSTSYIMSTSPSDEQGHVNPAPTEADVAALVEYFREFSERSQDLTAEELAADALAEAEGSAPPECSGTSEARRSRREKLSQFYGQLSSRSSGSDAGGCPFGGRVPTGSDPPGAWAGKSAAVQLEALWAGLEAAETAVGAPVAWPSLGTLKAELLGGNYAELLAERSDSKAPGAPCKSLCAVGMVCRAEIVWLESAGSGAFAGSSTGEGILRLSSALEPPFAANASSLPASLRASMRLFAGDLRKARLFPCAAFKLPRTNAPSANLLFAGRKVGQAGASFFEAGLATNVSEKASAFLRPVLEQFRKFSDHPTHLGLSDFAAASRDGAAATQHALAFPWALVLRPAAEVAAALAPYHGGGASGGGASDSAAFLRELEAVPAGTPLYDVIAVPSPDAAFAPERLRRVGRVVTRSRLLRSAADGALCFWHQAKEEDYARQPVWLEQLGKAHVNCGAEHFARLLAQQS